MTSLKVTNVRITYGERWLDIEHLCLSDDLDLQEDCFYVHELAITATAELLVVIVLAVAGTIRLQVYIRIGDSQD